MNRPLILVTNDDSVHSKGIKTLVDIVKQFGDVVVVSSEMPMSGKSSAITVGDPIRIRETVQNGDSVKVYAVTGTPVDCVKIAFGNLLDRRPDLVVSGINHGSNASVNVIYSGTLGAVLEACMHGVPAIGFSLLDHSGNADFTPGIPYISQIVEDVLKNGLPKGSCLNVNIPKIPAEEIKGIKVCSQADSYWTDSFEKRMDPYGVPYYWLTGISVCENKTPETDLWALENGYVTVVPTQVDMTDYKMIKTLETRYAGTEKK
ncbi:5'/3'-nucleotidase SurE [Bacteroidales bacterium OttesenSCG-928-C19]|nr:5'/3'-nucleotidase SurE [Bacteroidales bacterium OttesenSCG-928-C19]